jgi:hypothetical protein
MKVAEKIAEQIKRIPEDTTFGYKDLNITQEQYVTAAKALARLQKRKVIKKVSKGKFYKPKMTVFGELIPNSMELLKPYLFKDGKRVAYITGNYLYNQFGLTTQITNVLHIASRSKRIYINAGSLKAKPKKSYAEVTDDNFQLLGFLDALKDFKSIPDLDTKSAIIILKSSIEKLTESKLKKMIGYALLYPPRVRALLGALLEVSNIESSEINKLKKGLNPLTKYKYFITKEDLPTVINWNII